MFDLEKEIKKWRNSLRKHEALEDGYVSELESHLRDEIENLIKQNQSEEEAFSKAVKTFGKIQPIGGEYFKTDTRKRTGRPPWQSPYWMPDLLWNYFKIALRRIRRQKGYSFINIAGLSIGLACCMLIFFWVQHELSFDRFHENTNFIFVSRVL